MTQLAGHIHAEVTIRPFRLTDQTAARNLILQGLGDHFGEIRPELNPDLDDIQQNYVNEGALFVVAELQGRLVGTGALTLETANIGRIVRVSVDRPQRRQGIGRKLVQHLINTARSRGYSALLVETNADWQAAIALYHSFAFQPEAHRSGEIHMRLELAPR